MFGSLVINLIEKTVLILFRIWATCRPVVGWIRVYEVALGVAGLWTEVLVGNRFKIGVISFIRTVKVLIIAKFEVIRSLKEHVVGWVVEPLWRVSGEELVRIVVKIGFRVVGLVGWVGLPVEEVFFGWQGA